MKLLLILIALSLAGLIYYQAKYYPQIDLQVSEEPVLADSNVSLRQGGRRSKPLRAYEEIVERPLFSPDRRPPAVEGKAQVAESIDIGELENLTLFGVVISGDTRYAILGNSKDNTTNQIKEGHRYKGWRVSKISADSIMFEGEDAQYELFITPNETNKKSGIRNSSNTGSKRSSIFRSINRARKPPKSPLQLPARTSAATEKSLTEKQQEIIEKLGEEGGFRPELDEEFYDDEIE